MQRACRNEQCRCISPANIVITCILYPPSSQKANNQINQDTDDHTPKENCHLLSFCLSHRQRCLLLRSPGKRVSLLAARPHSLRYPLPPEVRQWPENNDLAHDIPPASHFCQTAAPPYVRKMISCIRRSASRSMLFGNARFNRIWFSP